MEDYSFSSFNDITRNLQQAISQHEEMLSGRIHESARNMGFNPPPMSTEERDELSLQMQAGREALRTYHDLLKEFPDFAKIEKTQTHGYFPDIGYPLNHVERVRIIAERLRKS